MNTWTLKSHGRFVMRFATKFTDRGYQLYIGSRNGYLSSRQWPFTSHEAAVRFVQQNYMTNRSVII